MILAAQFARCQISYLMKWFGVGGHLDYVTGCSKNLVYLLLARVEVKCNNQRSVEGKKVEVEITWNSERYVYI